MWQHTHCENLLDLQHHGWQWPIDWEFREFQLQLSNVKWRPVVA
jgi:hypothetical protein